MFFRRLVDVAVAQQDDGELVFMKYLISGNDSDGYSAWSEKYFVRGGDAIFGERAETAKYDMEKALQLAEIFVKGCVFPSAQEDIERDILFLG